MRKISRAWCVLLGLTGCQGGPNDDGGGSGEGGVPELAYCDEVVDWDAEWTSAEQQVLELVNEARTSGTSCGGVSAPATHPLTMNGALRCAARVHALDMAQRGYFDHVNPEGEDPFVRMGHAGYDYVAAGENIAAGQPDPQSVMDGWIASPGHCQNIMSADFFDLGVGHVVLDGSPYGFYWVQTFGQNL